MRTMEAQSGHPYFDQAHMVYVVDDEASVRRSLRRLLASLGLHSREFASGAEVLADEDRAAAACFLVDVHMPAMRGYEVVARLRDAAPESPVILMTAHVEDRTRWRVRADSAATLLLKPFSDRELIEALQQVLPSAL